MAAAGASREAVDAVAPEWDTSQAEYPPGGPPFLSPAYVRDAAALASLAPEAIDAAVRSAERIARSEALSRLAWHCRYALLRSATYPRSNLARWPAPVGSLGADAGLFFVLVVLSGVENLRAVYARRGIPDQVLRDTLYDLARWTEHYRERHGAWGLDPRYLSWLSNHLRAELFHLVRLQFQLNAFAAGYRAYRHRRSGEVIALAEAGQRFRSDGQVDGAGGVSDAGGAWTASLEEADGAVRGYAVAPTGFAVRREVRLQLSAWEPVLAAGDPVLQLHIPAGSPMDFDQCGQAFAAAMRFFPRHFPEFRFRAFACSSWLLDTQLDGLLPPGNNIPRFQREMYLLPSGGSGRSTLERVFGRVPEDFSDPAQAPRDTTLRRALLDHLLAGGHLRSGRCFLLREDLSWGSQVYRRQRLPSDGSP